MINHILNALGAVGNILDLPGSSVRDTLALRNPFDQWTTPLSTDNRTSGRDLLRHYGLAGQHDTWGNFAGGLAAETLLDPTNLIGGGIVKNILARRAATAADNAGIHAANALSMRQRAMGFFPEENIAHLHPIVMNEAGMPKTLYHGTPNAFDTHDLAKDSGANLFGPGAYYTDSPHVGSAYTDRGMRDSLSSEARDVLGDAVASAKQGSPQHNHLQMMSKQFDRGFYHANPADFALDLKAAGTHPGTIARAIAPAPQNVRMAYLDVRTPYDVGPNAPGFEAPMHATTGKPVHTSDLKTEGRDGIVHVGDHTTGDGIHAHNVVVALDPSQVYKPYIAKALKEPKGLPSVKPAARGLLAYNAFARSRSQQ